MTQVTYEKKQRLMLKKNWGVWLKLAGIWKNKKAPDPLRWQKRIRSLDRT